MRTTRKLMRKDGEVAVLLAREFLSYEAGARIKTVADYATTFATGRGTVQSALRYLKDERIVSLESRGHLGTFLTFLDYNKLWEIAGYGVIMGVMPLPYSKRYEGLATGLYKSFERANIPFSLAFMRGAEKRLQALELGKYDFAITSKLAAEHEKARFPFLDIVTVFSKGTYVNNHVLLSRDEKTQEIKQGLKVGIDPTSPDQYILTKHVCAGKDVIYVETPYNQFVEKLTNGEIDLAVWSEDEVKEKSLGLKVQPIENLGEAKLDYTDTMATIVINKENKELKEIIRKIVDLEYVESIQNKVLKREIIPMY